MAREEAQREAEEQEQARQEAEKQKELWRLQQLEVATHAMHMGDTKCTFCVRDYCCTNKYAGMYTCIHNLVLTLNMRQLPRIPQPQPWLHHILIIVILALKPVKLQSLNYCAGGVAEYRASREPTRSLPFQQLEVTLSCA